MYHNKASFMRVLITTVVPMILQMQYLNRSANKNVQSVLFKIAVVASLLSSLISTIIIASVVIGTI